MTTDLATLRALLAISERKRKAQRKELRRLNVHLAATRYAVAKYRSEIAALRAVIVGLKEESKRCRME